MLALFSKKKWLPLLGALNTQPSNYKTYPTIQSTTVGVLDSFVVMSHCKYLKCIYFLLDRF